MIITTHIIIFGWKLINIFQIVITEQDAALGVTLLGVSSIAGVIPNGVTSRLAFDRLIIHALCGILEAVFTLVIILATNKVC